MSTIERGRSIPPEDCYRILIVDGKDQHNFEMKSACKAAGQEVVEVGSVDEAKQFLETKNHVDVIVSEAFLETDNVFELLVLVKRDPRHFNVPVLLIADEPSALGESCLDSVASAADTLGAYDFVYMREFDIHLFMRKIKSILDIVGLPKKEVDAE